MSVEVKKIEEKTKEGKEKDEEDKEEVVKVDEDLQELKPETNVFVGKIQKEWQLILKIIQLVICALCFGFFFQPANQSANIGKHHLEQLALIILSFVGYILINSVFIVSRFLKDKIPFKTCAIFSIVASLINVISGILLIVDRKNKFQGTYYEPHMYLATLLSAATVLAFVNAILFATDGVYTYILKEDF